MEYKALNNKIIIKPIEVKTELDNGIVIQETRGKKDILVGEVVLAASSTGINPGSCVWYPEYASLPISLDGNNYLVIDYEDIIIVKEA